MIDANSQFFAILTNVGKAKQANADALGIPWKLTEMGVGDANGTDPIPSESQTRLINEWRRRPLNQLKIDPVNSAVIIAEQIIPADEGGRWIREIGLYDADGDLVAVANCAPSFKPVLSQGSGRTQIVRMNFMVTSAGNITLKIDPAIVLATRDYVDTRILDELYRLDSKQSVLAATTSNIALTGLQVIDGVLVPVGARVLVKNQAVAKDNGIYIAAAQGWARAPDADNSDKVTSALVVSVEQGVTLADTRWQLVTDGMIVLGTTALNFQDVMQGYAPIRSPAFLDIPTAPTAAPGTNSTQVATTAFVEAARTVLAAATALKAPIASPAFTGTPTATIPPTGVRGNAIATMQKFADEFLMSVSGNGGYQKLPSGLIVQWGAATVAVYGGTTVVFPTTFPNEGLCVVASDQASSPAAVEPMGAQIIDKSAFQAWYKSVTAGTFYWIAIGY
ncbi:phage tail protein [Pseudomonas moraviensis]